MNSAMIYKEITKKYTEAGYNVSNTKQIVMLYDGMVRFLRNAQKALEKEEFEGVFNNITKAKNIIQGLQLGIDFNQGGDIANTLNDFYDGMFFRLSLFNIKDPEHGVNYIKRIEDDIQKMRESWAEIDSQMVTQKNSRTR